MKFGEVAAADDTLAEAKKLLRNAEKPLEKRFTAEVAFLAVCQAADVAAAHFGHEEPEGFTSRIEALREFDENFETRTVDLFLGAKKTLHSECYYSGKCAGIEDGFDLAQLIVEAVGKHIGYVDLPYPITKNSPKRSKRRGRR